MERFLEGPTPKEITEELSAVLHGRRSHNACGPHPEDDMDKITARKIILDTPHGLLVEAVDGVYWMVPKDMKEPARVVVPTCNCLDQWFH